jgi:hypothetical protein
MKLSEVFDSQARRTVELVKSLENLSAQDAAIERQYAADDKLCVAKAAEYNAAATAGSPTARLLEVEVKRLRMLRDAPKAAHNRERAKIEWELESLTLPRISAFHQYALDFAKGLSTRLVLEKSEPYYDKYKDARMVTIKTNDGAIEEAVDLVMRRIAEVRAMAHRPLEEITKRIKECKKEFDDFNLTVVTDEKTLRADSAPKPIKPDRSALEAL